MAYLDLADSDSRLLTITSIFNLLEYVQISFYGLYYYNHVYQIYPEVLQLSGCITYTGSGVTE